MANQKPQNGSSNDVDPLLMAVGFMFVFALIAIFWNQFHTQIATAYAWLRVVQFSPFSLPHNIWTGGLGGVIGAAGLTVFFKKKQYAKYGLLALMAGFFLLASWLAGPLYESWFVFFKNSDKSLIEWSHLTKSSLFANLFTLVVAIIPFAIWVARKSLGTNPTNHKHFARGKDYTLHSYTDVMDKQYPHMKLFRILNLTARSINEGKYRMADTEKQFAIKLDLLDRVKANEFKVNRDRSAEVFRGQLGKLWTGFNGLTRWEFAVMAVLVPRLAATDTQMSDGDYKAALKMTEDLLAGYWRNAADSYNPAKDAITLDLTMAKTAIKKYAGSHKVQRFFKAHAYVGTVIYAMMLEARSLGVLQPAEFRWLRVADRRLWLTVDNVGRIVAFAEVGAIYSHFLNEVRQKRAIERPMIDASVKGLIEAVDSFKFSDSELDLINQRIASKEEQATIDKKATAKQIQNMQVMLLTIGEGDARDIFEAAVLDELGNTLYHQRCKANSPINALVRERFLMTDADVDALANAPTSAEVRTKLLDICNGHNLITFDKKDFELVNGLDRSAASLVDCRGDSEFDLSSTALMEGVIDEDKVAPIRDAVSAAKLCRLLWIDQQKAALIAESKAKAA